MGHRKLIGEADQDELLGDLVGPSREEAMLGRELLAQIREKMDPGNMTAEDFVRRYRSFNGLEGGEVEDGPVKSYELTGEVLLGLIPEGGISHGALLEMTGLAKAMLVSRLVALRIEGMVRCETSLHDRATLIWLPAKPSGPDTAYTTIGDLSRRD